MRKINVVYWSMTGNTKSMANAIADGIKSVGGEVNVCEISAITPDELAANDVFALGCPAMGAENLEESEVEPFVEELESKINGKKIALFGSYGWGDGTWMRDWVDRMTGAGAEVINGEGTICEEAPDDAAIKELTELGKKLASL